MLVFKFGGASVKNADAVRNIVEILRFYKDKSLVVVISAMGKTTNALENVVNAKYYNQSELEKALNIVEEYHLEIMNCLFSDKNHKVFAEIDKLFTALKEQSYGIVSNNYDYEYDQIVSYGELLSTVIVSNYINSVGIENTWQDIRDFVKTDNTYREAKVDWKVSGYLFNKFMYPQLNGVTSKIMITQGFIGGTTDNYTTTLGREGSDYTAAIIAHLLDAESVTIWKDVPGLLNADPKYFSKTVKIDEISYLDTIELSYYGATIIHPKTIKPLQNKNISLHVKSFIEPMQVGTVITEKVEKDKIIPSYIFKVNQMLLTIMPKDFSFIAEDNLSTIFGTFAKHNVKIHLMQNSAISFSVCIDNDDKKALLLIEELQKDYKIKYNTGLELITIRHYNQDTIDNVLEDKIILLEQKSRLTAQLVVKPN